MPGPQGQLSLLLHVIHVNPVIPFIPGCTGWADFVDSDLWASRTYQAKLHQRLVALYDASTIRAESKSPSLPSPDQIDQLQHNLG